METKNHSFYESPQTMTVLSFGGLICISDLASSNESFDNSGEEIDINLW